MRTDVVAAAMIVAFSLGGCVSHAWVAGPDVHATLAEQTAQCRIIARHGGSGFYASGSPGFVAGAAIGNAIGNAVQANADFNDCMAANGWEVADQQSAAVPIVVPPAPVAVAPSSPMTLPVTRSSVVSRTAVPTQVPLTPCGEDRPCNIQNTAVENS